MVRLLGFTYSPPSAVDKPYFNEPSKGDIIKAQLARDAKDRPTGYGKLIGSGIISAIEGAQNLTPRDIINAPYKTVTAVPGVVGKVADHYGKTLRTALTAPPLSSAQQKATTDLSLDLLGLSAVPGTAARMAGKQVARNDSTLGMFLGESALTADKAALAKAKKMTKVGKSRESILKQTGWFKDPADKRWKFEISDIDTKLAPVPANKKVRTNDPTKYYTSEVFDHPELFAAYPQLRNVEFEQVKGLAETGAAGSYTHGQRGGGWSDTRPKIKLDAQLTPDVLDRMQLLERKLDKDTASYREQIEYDAFRNTYPEYMSVEEWALKERAESGDRFATAEEMATAKEVGYSEIYGDSYLETLLGRESRDRIRNAGDQGRSTMLHELQHAVQDIENFGQGSNPYVSQRGYDDLAQRGMERRQDAGTLPSALIDEKGNVRPYYKASAELRSFDELVSDVHFELKKLGLYVDKGRGPDNLESFRPLRTEVAAPSDMDKIQPPDSRISLLNDKVYLQVKGGEFVGDPLEIPINKLYDQLMENSATPRQAKRLVDELKHIYKLQNEMPKYFGVSGKRHSLVNTKKGKVVARQISKGAKSQPSTKHIPSPLANPMERYQRKLGEAEARLVQTRRDIDPGWLRNRAPWKQLDVEPTLLESITAVRKNNPYVGPEPQLPPIRRFKNVDR